MGGQTGALSYHWLDRGEAARGNVRGRHQGLNNSQSIYLPKQQADEHMRHALCWV